MEPEVLNGFDAESQHLLQGMDFLDFNKIGFPQTTNRFKDFFKEKDKSFKFQSVSTHEIIKQNNYQIVVGDNNFSVYSDSEEDEGEKIILDEVVIVNNRYSKSFEGIDVILFISKNGANLLRQFKEVEPTSNELVLFLEKNDQHNIMGTVLRIKAGTDVTDKKLPLNEVMQFAKEKQVVLSQKDLKKLIENGLYTNKRSFFSWLVNVVTKALDEIFTFLTDKVLDGAGSFFEQRIGGAISGFKVAETSWNPNPTEGDYNPLFFPKAWVDNAENIQPKEEVKWMDNLLKPFEEKINATEKFFMGLLKEAEAFLPNFVYKKLQSVLQFLFRQMYAVSEFLKKPASGLKALFKRYLTIINAFLCGILNSIIDIFAGIFQIIGFVFKGISMVIKLEKGMHDVKTNAFYYGGLFAEVVENIIESVKSFDFLEFAKQVLFFQIKGTIRVYNYISKKVSDAHLEEYFYYFGYVIGMVIETLAEIFFTAGSATAAKWGTKITATAEKALGKITIFVKQALEKAKTVLDKVLDFINLILGKLKKGVKNLFEEFSAIVDEIFGAGQKVEDLPRTKAEERVLAKKEAQAKRLEKKNKGKKTHRGGGDFNKSFAENAGIKTEKWVSEATIIGQSTDHTCAATSLKMVLHDKGILKFDEDELARALKTDANGASIIDIPKALDFKRIDGVTAIAEKDIKFSKLLEKLYGGNKAIVSVYKKELGWHAMIIEKAENGQVFLRDPLPIHHGASYSMSLKDFKGIFNKKAVIVKF